ncbi:MAG: VWA domain-containing protein [Pseudomonadota bacterium]|nr:VWA domain-containing protein [Pseudomonadota bacterium]
MNHFANPEMFWLLVLPFLFRLFMPRAKGMHGDALKIPFLKDIEIISAQSGRGWRSTSGRSAFFSFSFFLLYLVWALLTAALARPQWIGEPIRLPGLSRDILLVADISTSMTEPDFIIGQRHVDRLTAIKKTATDFIRKRVDDRIGLILFGTRAYLQAPITFDKKSVEEILWSMDAGMAGNSTAIGDALGLALKTLRNSPNKDKKVIVLMTDGENNDGSLSIAQAVRLAKQENVKIYTIGVGSDNMTGMTLFGIQIGGSSGLDEESLAEIAEETKGTYFRAKDTKSLERIYEEIDRMETSRNDEQYIRETAERFYWPLAAAMAVAFLLLLYRRRK